MEPARLELATFCMPCRRAPNCAMAPARTIMPGSRPACNCVGIIRVSALETASLPSVELCIGARGLPLLSNSARPAGKLHEVFVGLPPRAVLAPAGNTLMRAGTGVKSFGRACGRRCRGCCRSPAGLRKTQRASSITRGKTHYSTLTPYDASRIAPARTTAPVIFARRFGRGETIIVREAVGPQQTRGSISNLGREVYPCKPPTEDYPAKPGEFTIASARNGLTHSR